MRNRGSSLLQFLHLSRPVQCSNMGCESCSRSAESQGQGQVHSTTPTTVPLMSPHPRTPQHRYPYQEPWVVQSSSPQAYRSPRDAYNIGYPYFMPESSKFQRQFAEPASVPLLVVAEVEEKVDQREAVDEIVRSIHRISELYEKLPEILQEQVNLEIMKIATTKRSGSPMDVGSVSSTSTRGLNPELGMESPHRLERFKIRTVNGGNIVKEEQKRK